MREIARLQEAEGGTTLGMREKDTLRDRQREIERETEREAERKKERRIE